MVNPEEIEATFEKVSNFLSILIAADVTKPKKIPYLGVVSYFLELKNIGRHDRNKEEAGLLAKLVNCDGDVTRRIMLLKSMDEPFIKGLAKRSYRKIGFKKIIYLERITQNKWDASVPSINSGPTRYRNAKKPNPAWKFSQNLTKKGNAEKIRVRVLAKHPLVLTDGKNPNWGIRIPFIGKKEPLFRPKNVVLNIHGGAFVAGSSCQLQIYTRE